jgi:glucosamine--fructose-6-phosphate aminotransferase (isomerizing)
MTSDASFMLREIGETGDAIARMRAGNAEAVLDFAARLETLDPKVVATIARGSSDHCALYLKYLAEIGLGIPCASIGPSIASLYDAPLRLKGALAISLSQSGRSPDIVAMQRAAKRAGAVTLAFVNDETSPLATEPDFLLPLRAGPERSVAATKTMIAGLVAGADLVAAWSRDAAMGAALAALPEKLVAQTAAPAEALVDLVTSAKSAFVLGRGATFAIAMEAALKLKETCAIHAEAFSAAEVLHGPAEIVTPGFLIIAFLPQDEAREGMNATLARFREMGARVLVVDAAVADGDDLLATADAGHPLITPILMIHRFYRLAEACARRLGRDADNPKNLRKVTETR